MGAFRERPGYTGYKTVDLLRAKGNGAKIVTTDPRWPDREVLYRPKNPRDMMPWHVVDEPVGWVRASFCKPVTQDGGPWSVGELIRLRL